MKTSYRITALLAAAAALGACGNDFLTEVPSDFVAPETFYRNAGDAVAAVNAAYATFVTLQSPSSSNDYIGRNYWMLSEYPTEVTTSRLSAANERSMIDNFHPQFNSTHTYLGPLWQAVYGGINRANSVIARVPDVPMDATRRDQIVAEAKFLRALHYYHLAVFFGGVPLKLDETRAITDAGIPRSTAAETFAQIAKDLTEAAAVLPTSWTGANYGRATKGAALALLGKAYLQSAAAFGNTADYAKAEAAFRQVLGLGYILDANYGSLFDGSNEQSKEIIFALQNIRVDGYGGRITEWFSPLTSPQIFQAGAQNQFQAERPFYDGYAATDIRKAGTWLTSITYNNKTVTWAWTSGIQTAANYGSTGPAPRKYVDFAAPDGGAEAPDYILLRYADVLLSLAEAINGQAGPTTEAYGFVNQVRARAKIGNFPAGLSQAVFRDSLYVERRNELAMEIHGVEDMRRFWSISKARVESNMTRRTTLNASPFTSSAPKATNVPIDDKWKLYPIPAAACLLNKELTQNPGWDDGICKPAGTP
jgi:starch-binding outer membrane protein, SusD/RagB family